MRRIAVLGASGRMGRMVVGEVLDADDLTLAAAVDRPDSPVLGSDAGTLAGRSPSGVSLRPLGPGAFGDAEVIVDFSLPHALRAALPLFGPVALVSGTTGLDDSTAAALREHAQVAGVVQAANFSTGVNVLLDLAERAARALPDADLEIVETHHRHKRDAPSGTALALGRRVASARGVDHDAMVDHGRFGDTGPRPPGRLAYHALRGGDVPGDHTLWLLADGERISLGHVATSRRTFALGALRAARWVASRPPGMWTMAQVLDLEKSR